jgi:hypothetical protein
MVAADTLLLLAPEGPNGSTLLPAKAFEYLASGQPILAVGPAGASEVRQLMAECTAGVFVNAEAEAVRTALTHLWHRFRAGALPVGCPPVKLTPFARKQLAGRLAEVLELVRTGSRRWRAGHHASQ